MSGSKQGLAVASAAALNCGQYLSAPNLSEWRCARWRVP
jgi:hypothetical protein